MQILFLGGPWHGERHDVTPSRRARGSEGLPRQYSVREPTGGDVAGQGVTTGEVTYIRRFAQSGGERKAVYVAPDYRGPARA